MSTRKKPSRKVVKSARSSKRVIRASKAIGNPYRPTSNYGILFAEGSKKFQDKDELIKAVAKLTRKSETKVGFNFNVLKTPASQSNKGKSKLDTNAQGLIKFIALERPEKPAKAAKVVKVKAVKPAKLAKVKITKAKTDSKKVIITKAKVAKATKPKAPKVSKTPAQATPAVKTPAVEAVEAVEAVIEIEPETVLVDTTTPEPQAA